MKKYQRRKIRLNSHSSQFIYTGYNFKYSSKTTLSYQSLNYSEFIKDVMIYEELLGQLSTCANNESQENRELTSNETDESNGLLTHWRPYE